MSRFHIDATAVLVDDDEGRFCLVVLTENGDLQIDIHDAVLDFYAGVRKHIGPYAAEAESARKAVAAGMSRADYLDSPRPVRSRPVSVEDAVEAGYALDDPKSPGFHDRMVD